MSDYLKKAKAEVKWLKQHGKNATTRAHNAVVNLAAHVKEHNDWTFIQEIDEQVRVCRLGIEKFRAWVPHVFVGLKFDKETGRWLRKAKKKAITINDAVLAEHWDDYVQVSTFVPDYDKMFNLDLMLKAQQKKLEAAEEAEEVKGDRDAMLARKEAIETFQANVFQQ